MSELSASKAEQSSIEAAQPNLDLSTLDGLGEKTVIFGNPRAGAPLMQAVQTIGIDLPLKAPVWQDDSGTTWLGYNDPVWLAARHGADAGAEKILGAMTDVLAAVAEEATSLTKG